MRSHCLVLALLVFGFLPAFTNGQTTLTNGSVVEMCRVGIPSTVIITKVKNSSVNFDTSLSALKALSDSGVPDAVVSAMIEAESLQKKNEPVVSQTAVVKAPVTSPIFIPYGRLDKEAQKQRLKSPAVVGIAAPASDVLPLLVRGFQSWDYQVDEETTRSLQFSKPAKGFGDQLLIGLALGGNNWRYKVQVSIGEYQGISSVSVRAWGASDNAFGKTSQTQLDGSKKWREQLDDLLLAAKSQAETGTTSTVSLSSYSTTSKESANSIASVSNPDGFPVRWKSMASGATRVLRKDGDSIYIEAELTPEQQELGESQRGEVKKDGDHYTGTLRSTVWFWWKTNPVTGKKYTEKVCWDDDQITLKIVNPTRIEVDGLAYPAGTKYDKNCKPNKKKGPWPTSVWIPLDQQQN